MALLLVGVLIGYRGFSTTQASSAENTTLGGPLSLDGGGSFSDLRLAMLVGDSAVTAPQAPNNDEVALDRADENDPLLGVLRDDGALQKEGTVSRPDLVLYTVKKGDTFSEISQDFGVSEGAIRKTNGMSAKARLRVGQQLFVTALDAVAYRAKSGDSLDTISLSFGVDAGRVQEANAMVNFDLLEPGTPLLIPGALSPQAVPISLPTESKASSDSGPLLKGYFIMPTKGLSWGVLHPHNAVDIANACGTPVRAAAEGVVVADPNLGDGTGKWNDGYGHFVLLEHANGTKTRYAHLQNIEVSVGQYLTQGDELGTMGNTGNTHGPTGCHLHFEVLGAKNPFAR